MANPAVNRRSFLGQVGRGALASLGLSAVPALFSCSGNGSGPGTSAMNAGVATGSGAARAKPNILFIAVDDLRPQMGCYGVKDILSPNLDGLAARGTVFERCYCQVPVCGASRASLLTGIRPTPTRFLDFLTRADVDAPGITTLPLYLRGHGYQTASLGKIFHHLDDALPAWSETPWRPESNKTGRCYLVAENIRIAAEAKGGKGPAFEAPDVSDSDYPDGQIADRAIQDLARLSGTGRPFFLAVGFTKPHLPFNAPLRYWSMYNREAINLAKNPFRPDGAPKLAIHNSAELRGYRGIPPKGSIPDDLARSLVHGYYACVSYMDAQLGRVLRALDDLGQRENTIVVLWGDHGWQLGEHTMWCKHCNFQTSLRAPLIVSAPGLPGGTRTRAITEFVDVYPSLCALAGLPLPEHLEGASLAPLLNDPNRAWKDAAFSRWQQGDTITTDRYSYTEWRDKNDEFLGRMLYDHDKDPDENFNLSEKPENKELVETLSRRLRAGWKAVAAAAG